MNSIKFKKPKRQIDTVFLHCSASDRPEHDSIQVIKKWHTDPKPQGKGWSDVGYHYFIRKDGTIERGRSLEKIPAAQKGYNSGSIAICAHGLDIDKFTEVQLEAVKDLCKTINLAYGNYLRFRGHCEVNSNKTCPVFDYKELLNLDENGKMV